MVGKLYPKCETEEYPERGAVTEHLTKGVVLLESSDDLKNRSPNKMATDPRTTKQIPPKTRYKELGLFPGVTVDNLRRGSFIGTSGVGSGLGYSVRSCCWAALLK